MDPSSTGPSPGPPHRWPHCMYLIPGVSPQATTADVSKDQAKAQSQGMAGLHCPRGSGRGSFLPLSPWCGRSLGVLGIQRMLFLLGRGRGDGRAISRVQRLYAPPPAAAWPSACFHIPIGLGFESFRIGAIPLPATWTHSFDPRFPALGGSSHGHRRVCRVRGREPRPR